MKNLKQHINDTALSIFVWSDEGGRNALAEQLEKIAHAHAKDQAIAFATEYAYHKANPDGKMDVPSIVYEDAEKAYDTWIAEQVIKELPKETV
jgi:hypothetical protein